MAVSNPFLTKFGIAASVRNERAKLAWVKCKRGSFSRQHFHNIGEEIEKRGQSDDEIGGGRKNGERTAAHTHTSSGLFDKHKSSHVRRGCVKKISREVSTEKRQASTQAAEQFKHSRPGLITRSVVKWLRDRGRVERRTNQNRKIKTPKLTREKPVTFCFVCKGACCLLFASFPT